jgi:hypothetical protein
VVVGLWSAALQNARTEQTHRFARLEEPRGLLQMEMPISNEPNPIHTYVATGTFTVTLTVGNGEVVDTMVDVGCITVSEAGQAIYLPVILKNQP